MKEQTRLLLPASCCMLTGLSLHNASPEVGFTIFMTSFYFLEKWKSYVLHPQSKLSKPHVKRK